MTDVSAANREQQHFWNHEGGAAWIDLQDRMDVQLEPLGAAALAAARPVSGERVLDVGCGCGTTTMSLGEAVGPSGSVLGLDISEPMVEVGRRRADARAMSHVQFRVGDAQVESLPASSIDLVYSRFGVMFFADPVAAFANLRRATAENGRLAFVCWQSAALNEWASGLGRVLAPLLPPQPPPDPTAPGPFAFADAERVRTIVTTAGWAEVAVRSLVAPMLLFGSTDLDDLVGASLRIGPAARALGAAGPDSDLLGRARAAVRNYLEPLHRSDGIRMDGAAWIVTARHSAS